MADDSSAEEKTEEATPRKRLESRERGQVALSNESIVALMLVAVMVSFFLTGPRLFAATGEIVTGSIASLPVLALEEISLPDSAALVRNVSKSVYPAFITLVLPVMLAGLIVAYGQVGFQIAPKAVAFDPAKLNPIKGVQRMFSARSVMRVMLAAAKITLIMTVVGATAWLQMDAIGSTMSVGMGPALLGLTKVVTRCAVAGLVTIVILAVVDLVFQRFQHSKDMRMTKKEVKDEWKSTEGDPHIKSRIRQIQREVASRRMMEAVPDATVVITNPTHYAVALAYDRDEAGLGGAAPVIVAKGVDEVALRIKEVAREANVPLYEDVPLARALHAQCEIGDQIPEDLFHAVAGVLAYVYGLEGARAGA